jgi:hypothetical protein
MARRVKNNWIYTGDKGVDFGIHLAADIISQDVVGGSDLVDKSLYAMPTNLEPRKAEVFNATEGTRYVPCMDEACDLWATPGTTITLPVFNDVDGAVFTRTGKKLPERQRRGNDPTT